MSRCLLNGGVFCSLPGGTIRMYNYSYQHEDSDS